MTGFADRSGGCDLFVPRANPELAASILRQAVAWQTGVSVEDSPAEVPFVVHTAAPPVGTAQPCASCGWPLADNTAWFEGRVAVPEADAGRGPSWWPVGQRIATDKQTPSSGGMTYLLNDRPLADDERLCSGTN